jgi:hypothetical protein
VSRHDQPLMSDADAALLARVSGRVLAVVCGLYATVAVPLIGGLL